MTALDDKVIASLYAAVECDGRWTELMDGLRHRLNVHSVVAQVVSGNIHDARQLWTTRDSGSQRLALLHDSWANSRANPRFGRTLPKERTDDVVISSDQRLPDYTSNDRELLRNGLHRCGLGQAFWLSVYLDPLRHFTLIFHRMPGDDRDMGAGDVDTLQALAPHMRQAARLWWQLGGARQHARLVEKACEIGEKALLTCTPDLNLIWANDAARRICNSGGPLSLRRGNLTARTTADRASLRHFLSGHAQNRTLVLGQNEERPLHARLVEIDEGDVTFACDPDAKLLMLAEPATSFFFNEKEVSGLFGLTPTEAALAAMLARGETVGTFAQSRGIAESTARLHLKRTLSKVGVSRQFQLVKTICQSVAAHSATTG